MTAAHTTEALKTSRLAGGIRNKDDLIEADEVLDALAAEHLRNSQLHRQIKSRARAYVREHLQTLMATPWVHNGGAVYDIIEEEREAHYAHLLTLEGESKQVH